ncbi:putative acetolactate synthase small subunit [Gossypium arboreum]|uniref:Putative acetolactate synthase small subunit n=1 Tax=Gossypium arboreum TaxID=29729 RepID=A0A0B0P2J9_GOSAR|nr:putative acetolactate synthase small subunit [Gossypium arboreum]
MIEQGKLKFGLKWGKYQVVDEMVKIAIFAYEEWIRIQVTCHWDIWASELVELSPSSLMGGLHGSLATYVALMCKLSIVDKPARKSETVGGTLTLSVYHLGVMACIF